MFADARKKQFAVASEKHIPPYNWIPPEKPPLLQTLNQEDFPNDNLPECLLAENDFEPDAGRDLPTRDEKGRVKLAKVPNPGSVFAHVHEGQGFGSEANDAAFERLRLAFNFIVCRTIELCSAINGAVKSYDADNEQTWKPYNDAREAYMEFLRNSDNHHPEGQPGLAELRRGLGYAKHYEWLFIDPVIKMDETANGKHLITGAVIVLQWNPNSSSSGIPIKH
jgi:hypothetical protein